MHELSGLNAGPFVMVFVEPFLELPVSDHDQVGADEQGAAHRDDLRDDLCIVVVGETAFGPGEAIRWHTVRSEQALGESVLGTIELSDAEESIAVAPLARPPALFTDPSNFPGVPAVCLDLLCLAQGALGEAPGADSDLWG